jgi:hypothetical protein
MEEGRRLTFYGLSRTNPRTRANRSTGGTESSHRAAGQAGGGLHSMDFHARTLERELTAAREELKAVTEQRDRLAEALREIEVIRWLCDGKVIATEALQSLNQPEP